MQENIWNFELKIFKSQTHNIFPDLILYGVYPENTANVKGIHFKSSRSSICFPANSSQTKGTNL